MNGLHLTLHTYKGSPLIVTNMKGGGGIMLTLLNDLPDISGMRNANENPNISWKPVYDKFTQAAIPLHEVWCYGITMREFVDLYKQALGDRVAQIEHGSFPELNRMAWSTSYVHLDSDDFRVSTNSVNLGGGLSVYLGTDPVLFVKDV